MIRCLGFYKRRPDLTHDQFVHHWMNVHGPICANLPGGERYLKKYIQHQLAQDPAHPRDLVYDGFSEAWWESLGGRDEYMKLPGFSVVVEDEPKFVDMTATRWMVIDEHVLQVDRAEWPHPPIRP